MGCECGQNGTDEEYTENVGEENSWETSNWKTK